MNLIFNLGKYLLLWFSFISSQVFGSQDAYIHITESLAKGDVQRAKNALGIIGTKLTKKDDRFIYYQSLINFLDSNYEQVRKDLDDIAKKSTSPYFGKSCHLKWMNELYLSRPNELQEVMKTCSGKLAQENNLFLYWHTKTTLLKVDYLNRPWATETLQNSNSLLDYKPLGSDVDNDGKVRHLRQWYKLNYFHQNELGLNKFSKKVPSYLMKDNEVTNLVDMIKFQQQDLPEQDLKNKSTDLNMDLIAIYPAIRDGSWVDATTKLEELWNLYPYSYNVNSLLALMYWLTGKTQDSMLKIQHLTNTFQDIPTDLLNLSALVLMQNHLPEDSKKILYKAPRPQSNHSAILKDNLWQWIGLEQNNHNLVFQSASTACALGDRESCPLSYSYWRKTEELTGSPPSID
jgi:hypothetical protein